MRESPRIRRLRTDRKSLEKLRLDSSILDFIAYGEPAERYVIRFAGRGLWRPHANGDVALRDHHEVLIELGASYPRMMPELLWKSPIFHPNISASGVVCLGGYGTYWVPSLNLDELCEMLWDMLRYRNYDVDSPYNREAAMWARHQPAHRFPVDQRPIRDKVAGVAATGRRTATNNEPTADNSPDVMIIDAEVVEATVVTNEDILFLE